MKQPGFVSTFLAFLRAAPSLKTITRIDEKLIRMYNRLRRFDGRELIYIREGYKLKIKGLVNSSKQENNYVEEWLSTHEVKEFVFLTSELVDEKGNFIEPKDGDRIRIGNKEFYIMQLPNSSYYNYTDAGEILTIVKGTLR